MIFSYERQETVSTLHIIANLVDSLLLQSKYLIFSISNLAIYSSSLSLAFIIITLVNERLTCSIINWLLLLRSSITDLHLQLKLTILLAIY